MNSNKEEISKDDINVRLNYGVIITGTPVKIRELKLFLQKNNFEVRYQRPSTHFLRILDEEV